MKIILVAAICCVTGCSAIPAALPAWWTSNKVYLLEAGIAASSVTQIEQFGLTTKMVADEVWKK